MLLKMIGNWVNGKNLFGSDYFEGSPMSFGSNGTSFSHKNRVEGKLVSSNPNGCL